jgi:chromosome segregation ATPase
VYPQLVLGGDSSTSTSRQSVSIGAVATLAVTGIQEVHQHLVAANASTALLAAQHAHILSELNATDIAAAAHRLLIDERLINATAVSDSLQSQITDVISSADNVTLRVTELETAHTVTQQHMHVLQAAAATANATLHVHDDGITQLHEADVALNSSICNVNATVSKHELAIAVHATDITELQQQTAAAAVQAVVLNGSIQANNVTLQAHAVRLTALESENILALQRDTDANNSIQAVHATLALHSANLTSISTSVTDAHSELQALKAALAVTNTAAQKQATTITEAAAAHTALLQRVTLIEQQLQTAAVERSARDERDKAATEAAQTALKEVTNRHTELLARLVKSFISQRSNTVTLSTPSQLLDVRCTLLHVRVLPCLLLGPLLCASML